MKLQANCNQMNTEMQTFAKLRGKPLQGWHPGGAAGATYLEREGFPYRGKDFPTEGSVSQDLVEDERCQGWPLEGLLPLPVQTLLCLQPSRTIPWRKPCTPLPQQPSSCAWQHLSIRQIPPPVLLCIEAISQSFHKTRMFSSSLSSGPKEKQQFA